MHLWPLAQPQWSSTSTGIVPDWRLSNLFPKSCMLQLSSFVLLATEENKQKKLISFFSETTMSFRFYNILYIPTYRGLDTNKALIGSCLACDPLAPWQVSS